MSNISQFFSGYSNYPFPINVSNDPVLCTILLVGGGGGGGLNDGTATTAAGGGGGGEVVVINNILLRRGLTFNVVIGTGSPTGNTPVKGGDSSITLVPGGGTLQQGLGSIVAKGGSPGASANTGITYATTGGSGGGGGSRNNQRSNTLYPWGGSSFKKNQETDYIKIEADITSFSTYGNRGGNGLRQDASLASIYAGGGGGGAGGPGEDGRQDNSLTTGGAGGRSYRWNEIPNELLFPSTQPGVRFLYGGGGSGGLPNGFLPPGSQIGNFDFKAPNKGYGWGGIGRKVGDFVASPPATNISAPGFFILVCADSTPLSSISGGVVLNGENPKPFYNVYICQSSGSFTV